MPLVEDYKTPYSWNNQAKTKTKIYYAKQALFYQKLGKTTEIAVHQLSVNKQTPFN